MINLMPQKLEKFLIENSIGKDLNIPDFILAEYLCTCLRELDSFKGLEKNCNQQLKESIMNNDYNKKKD